jgi:hypothetical protein
MPNLSMRAYARRRSVALAAVQKAIESGRISLQPDGSINPEVADRQWEDNTRPVPPSAVAVKGVLRENGSGHGLSQYTEARAERERYVALLARLKYEERAGGLVRADQVEDARFKEFRAFRDRMQSIPDRVAAIIAGVTDPAEIHKMLSTEIEKALSDFADQRSV